MKPNWAMAWLVGAFAALLVLAGCDSISGGSSSSSPVKLIGTSGDEVSLNGTWSRGCTEDGTGGSEDDSFKYDGSKVSGTFLMYGSVLDCSGDVDATTKIGGKLTYDQPVDMTDWIDGNGAASTPPTGLSSTENANGTTFDFTSAKLTPENAGTATFLNDDKYCGFTDWEAGTAKDVLDCFLAGSTNPSKSTVVLDDTTSTTTMSIYESRDGSTVLDASGYPTEILNVDPTVK